MKVDLKRVAGIRRMHGHSQREIADALGIHVQSYSRKERGIYPFKVAEIIYLENLYGEKFKMEESK